MYTEIQTQPKGSVQYVAQTFDWKRQSATYSVNYGYGLKNKGAGVLPACCDIDRACPSLMQQRTKLW